MQSLQRGCLSPEILELKRGAVVMFTKNDPAGRYVNGTLGIVEDFGKEDGEPMVKTRSGKRIFAEPVNMEDRRRRQGARQHHASSAPGSPGR